MEERLDVRLPTWRRVALMVGGALLGGLAGALARRALDGRVAPWLAEGALPAVALGVTALAREYWRRGRPLGHAVLEGAGLAGCVLAVSALWTALGWP